MTALEFSTPLSNRGPSLSDLAFERIADAIVDGQLAPGEVLRDHALAQQLGVSRMPVREALQRLERAGLVETAASRYTRVTSFTPERVAAGIEYAGFLYGAAMRLAVSRMTDEEQSQALDILGRLQAAEGADECLRAISELFRFAVTAAGNEVLHRRRDVSYLLACIARAMPVEDRVEPIRRERQRLREAVAARDADAAESAVRRMHGIA